MKSLQLFAGILTAAVATQTTALGAQQPMPIHPLGPVIARAKDVMSQQMTVRQLPDGYLLVNDPASRRLLLLDSTLAIVRTVADSNPSSPNPYGPRGGAMFGYRGDSTLFLDATAISFLLIDPSGKVIRVMSVPKPSDVQFLSQSITYGTPGFDPQGRLIYRSRYPFVPGREGGPGGASTPPVQPDSAPIVRIDMVTHKVDTIGALKIPKQMSQSAVTGQNGKMTMTATIDPLQLEDDWTVTSDGILAIIRAQDYHVDFIHSDASKVSSPKLPHVWHRLTDDERTAIVAHVQTMADSIVAGILKQLASQPARSGAPPPPSYNIGVLAPSDLIDYASPFSPYFTKADVEGNIWVQAALGTPKGSIPGLSNVIPTAPTIAAYEVINSKGEMIDRVQLPRGRVIVGFGPGVVYLAAQDSTYVPPSLASIAAARGGATLPSAPYFLERARIH